MPGCLGMVAVVHLALCTPHLQAAAMDDALKIRTKDGDVAPDGAAASSSLVGRRAGAGGQRAVALQQPNPALSLDRTCSHVATDCLDPSCLPCLQRCGRPALPGLPGLPAAAQGSAQRRDGGRQEAERAARGHQLGWVGVRGLNIAAQQLQLPGWLGNRGRRQQWPCCRPFSSQLSILSLQSADSIRLRAFAAAAVGPLRTAILKFYAQVGGAGAVCMLRQHCWLVAMQKDTANVLLVLSKSPTPTSSGLLWRTLLLQASSHSYRLLSLKANGKFESIDSGDKAPLNVSWPGWAWPCFSLCACVQQHSVSMQLLCHLPSVIIPLAAPLCTVCHAELQ